MVFVKLDLHKKNPMKLHISTVHEEKIISILLFLAIDQIKMLKILVITIIIYIILIGYSHEKGNLKKIFEKGCWKKEI